MIMEIKSVKGGFYKRVGSCSDFDTDMCPFCKVDLKRIADLYDQPNPPELEAWAKKKDSMESTLYQCPKCGKHFMYWETLDYDYFHLQEVEVHNPCLSKG